MFVLELAVHTTHHPSIRADSYAFPHKAPPRRDGSSFERSSRTVIGLARTGRRAAPLAAIEAQAGGSTSRHACMHAATSFAVRVHVSPRQEPFGRESRKGNVRRSAKGHRTWAFAPRGCVCAQMRVGVPGGAVVRQSAVDTHACSWQCAWWLHARDDAEGGVCVCVREVLRYIPGFGSDAVVPNILVGLTTG
eukprot:GHVU01154044.1.p1 GENE.GHVU01154044.1~~GHVU01154044.1.p1  ORF type:complete len:192 (-),score=6.65 GHVU01154044.1:730-1305(-)